MQALASENNVVVAGFENGVNIGYDNRNGNKVFTIDSLKWVRSLQMDQNVLISGSENGEVKMFDLRSHKLPCSVIQAHKGKVLTMCLDSNRLVSGGSDSLIHYFKFAS